jgi:hypothetical protein
MCSCPFPSLKVLCNSHIESINRQNESKAVLGSKSMSCFLWACCTCITAKKTVKTSFICKIHFINKLNLVRWILVYFTFLLTLTNNFLCKFYWTRMMDVRQGNRLGCFLNYTKLHSQIKLSTLFIARSTLASTALSIRSYKNIYFRKSLRIDVDSLYDR